MVAVREELEQRPGFQAVDAAADELGVVDLAAGQRDLGVAVAWPRGRRRRRPWSRPARAGSRRERPHRRSARNRRRASRRSSGCPWSRLRLPGVPRFHHSSGVIGALFKLAQGRAQRAPRQAVASPLPATERGAPAPCHRRRFRAALAPPPGRGRSSAAPAPRGACRRCSSAGRQDRAARSGGRLRAPDSARGSSDGAAQAIIHSPP